MSQGIENGESAAPRVTERPGVFIRWSARALCWLCWVGIGFAIFGEVMHTFYPNLSIGLSSASGATVTTAPAGASDAPAATLVSFGVKFSEAANNTDEVWRNLRTNWPNAILSLASTVVYIWALLSARQSFIGVGRGEYFSRSTILGLRNLSLAVLLYHTVAPVIEMIPRALYFNSIKNGRLVEFSLSIGVNEGIALALISAAVVALVSTVMAHASTIADENRQFV